MQFIIKPFTNVRSIFKDKKGNIWTSSESGNGKGWVLSRYDEKTLTDKNKKPTATEITNRPMIFGILEANDGSICFGDLDGAHRYDRKTITDFKSKESQK